MPFGSQRRGKSTGASGHSPAPVIAEPYKRGLDRDFRLADDPPHVFRINQNPPNGLRRKLHEFVAVAGITQPEVRDNAVRFIRGSGRQLALQRQPDNPFDPNAIAVIGTWSEMGEQRSGRLGYLPADIAQAVKKNASDLPIGATLEVMYDCQGGRSPGIRLAVWVPARKPRSVTEKPRQDIPIPSDPVERNIKGQELEKRGYIEDAIQFYQANVRDGFDGNHPYDRLAVISRRRRDYAEEVAVLERAVSVFEGLAGSPRADVAPKLERFRARLAKARDLAHGIE